MDISYGTDHSIGDRAVKDGLVRRLLSDRKTVDAVIRNFIIIDEAASRVPSEIESMHPEIPWKDMRDMRNFVVHEYFGISDKILWDTIQKSFHLANGGIYE